jgi:hypothetical protein
MENFGVIALLWPFIIIPLAVAIALLANVLFDRAEHRKAR